MVDSLAIGGAEWSAVHLAGALHRGGHGVVVAASAGGPLLQRLEQAGVVAHLAATGPVKRQLSVEYARSLRQVVRDMEIDIVHAHCYASITACAWALKGTEIPLVITEHTESLWEDEAARSIHRCARRRAAAVIAVSPGIRDALLGERDEDGGWGGMAPILHIPNAVPAADLETDGVRAEWGSPVVGVFARMEPEKGVDVFLHAFARLQGRHRGVHALLAGDGSLLPGLRELAETLGLGSAVTFLGPCLEARARLPQLTLLAVPSRSEGAPLIVLEGMMAGIPIVATAAGGVTHQIRHGQEGLLVPAGDPIALAGGMEYVLTHPAEAARMARAGRRRAREEFDFDVMVDAVMGVYRDVLGKGGEVHRWVQGHPLHPHNDYDGSSPPPVTPMISPVM